LSPPGVSVLVVNWNTRDLLARCLASLRETSAGLRVETWVVDNGSTDGSPGMVEERFPEVHLLRQTKNLGFAKAVNLARARAGGDYVLLLNSDAVLLPGALVHSVGEMERDGSIEVLGCRLLGDDRRVQSSCGHFPSLRTLWWQNVMVAGHRVFGRRAVRFLSRLSGVGIMPVKGLVDLWDPERVADVDWVSGAFLLTRRRVFERVGDLDEGFWLFGEDMDWCRRVRTSGGRVVYDGRAAVLHLGGGSTGAKAESDLRHYRAAVRLYEKHRGRFQALGYRLVLGTAALLTLAGLGATAWRAHGRPDAGERRTRAWGLLRLAGRGR
jgi:N-acetylglucosaminyl-diphospho-decaprenol L-rhamnosyltransferase